MANDLVMRVVLNMQERVAAQLKRLSSGSHDAAKALKATTDRLKALEAQQKQLQQFQALKRGLKDTTVELKAANQRARDVGEQLKRLTAEANPATHAVKRLTEEQKKAQAVVDKLNASYRTNLERHRELALQLSASGSNVMKKDVMRKAQSWLRDDIALTNVQLDTQKRKLAAIAEQQKNVAMAQQRAGQMRATAGAMAGTGAGMTASGGASLYAGARILAPGLQFEESMSSVQALTRLKKESAELNELRQQARQLGASTSFTATEAGNAQGFLAMAGLKPQAILDAMPSMLDLAKAGRTELASSADIASNILTSFKLDASEIGRLSDVLVGTFTRSNVNLQMLGETMKYIGSVARGMGIDVETTAAMAGKLGDAGTQGSMGGTALRAIMSRLSAPPKMAAEALEELGVKAADAHGNLRPLPDILTELDAKTKKMGTTQRAGYFKHIAGEEAFAALATLTDQAGSGQLQQLITELRNANGEAQQNAIVMADNASGDIKTLKSAWEELGITLFDTNNGPLRELLQTINGLIGKTTQWIKDNPELASTLVKVAAVTAGLLVVGGSFLLMLAGMLAPMALLRVMMAKAGLQGAMLMPILRGIGSVFMWLGRIFLMNPIGLAITAIAGAAYLIYRNWDQVASFFTGLWGQVRTAFSGGITGVIGLILNWSPLGLFHRAFAGVLNWFGIALPAKFTDFGIMILQGLANGITSALGTVKNAVVNAGSSVINWFKERLNIHSPSRVFAELGDYTMQGLALGLTRTENEPLTAVSNMARKLAGLGAGIAISGASMPAMAFDARPPLAASTASATAGMIIQGDTIHISIQAMPGMNEQAIARAIASELDRREREKTSRLRAALHDRY